MTTADELVVVKPQACGKSEVTTALVARIEAAAAKARLSDRKCDKKHSFACGVYEGNRCNCY